MPSDPMCCESLNTVMFPNSIPFIKWTFHYPTLKAPYLNSNLLIQDGTQLQGSIKVTSGTHKLDLIDPHSGVKKGILKIELAEEYRTVHNTDIYTTLFTLYPWLLDHECTNVIVAGGAITRIIQDLARGSLVSEIDNVDLFIYGTELNEFKDKIAQLITVIKKYYSDLELIYQGRILTLLSGSVKIKLWLHPFATPGQVLQSFDLGASMVGVINFHQPTLITTNQGFMSLTNRINIVDPKHNSEYYTQRLIKYFYRGFAISFPHLKLNSDHQILLPSCTLNMTTVSGNQMTGTIELVHSDNNNNNIMIRVKNFNTGADALKKIAEVPEFEVKLFRKYVPDIYRCNEDILDLKLFEQIPEFDYNEFMKARKLGDSFIESYLFSIYYEAKTKQLRNEYQHKYERFAKMELRLEDPLYGAKRTTDPNMWYGSFYQRRSCFH